MPSSIKLKKGLDIRIEGHAEKSIVTHISPVLYAVKPTDFPSLIPKLNVKAGDKILAGSPLFHDKLRPEILYTSPVSGKVVSINRGDHRKLLEIVVEKDGEEFIDFGRSEISSMSSEFVKKVLQISGLWPSVRQRPYHIVANPLDVPKAIFVSAFDSAPLAPDYNYIFENSSYSEFRNGIIVLSKLVGSPVNLILNGSIVSPELLKDLTDVNIHYFSGPHPSGNVGVHIHHLAPVNKGEVVWYVNFQDVFTIGRLFAEGRYRPEKIIALTGSEVLHKQYYRTIAGASISEFVRDNVKPGHLRFISGNVLTGTKITSDGFLGFYDSQFTVIPEGDYSEFFGWIKPGFDKFSFYKIFASKLFPGKSYRLDTNLHGGERSFVLTGKYEQVVPMDIFPMQLLKAILAEDIDNMENLGIYEIAEEDFALCEYICPSKTEIQSIVRKGLDLMIREMS
jgi:Na+-transporting NADH:ubiquinone oxidoreductase subunit A